MKEVQYNWDLAHGYREEVAKAHVKFRLFQRFSAWYSNHAYDILDLDWTRYCNRQAYRNRRIAIKYYL